MTKVERWDLIVKIAGLRAEKANDWQLRESYRDVVAEDLKRLFIDDEEADEKLLSMLEKLNDQG